MASKREENNVRFTLRRLGDQSQIDISEAEFETIKSSKELYSRVIRMEENFEAVLEDYAELEETLSHYGIRHLVFHQADFQSMRNIINRRLLHLLATALLYRDGLLKHGKLLLKKDNAFQTLKSELTDSPNQPIEFRIVEALRDYSQHEDFPISEMSTTSQWEDNDKRKKERGAHFITVNIDASAIGRRRNLAPDLKDALVKMGPKTEMIGHIRKYVEYLGSIHAVFRKLINAEEKRWEKIMRDAMNRFHLPPDIKGLPLVIFATKKDSSGHEIQLFEDFFDSLALLRTKNGTQQTLSKRYVRWSGLPPD